MECQQGFERCSNVVFIGVFGWMNMQSNAWDKMQRFVFGGMWLWKEKPGGRCPTCFFPVHVNSMMDFGAWIDGLLSKREKIYHVITWASLSTPGALKIMCHWHVNCFLIKEDRDFGSILQMFATPKNSMQRGGAGRTWNIIECVGPSV